VHADHGELHWEHRRDHGNASCRCRQDHLYLRFLLHRDQCNGGESGDHGHHHRDDRRHLEFRISGVGRCRRGAEHDSNRRGIHSLRRSQRSQHSDRCERPRVRGWRNTGDRERVGLPAMIRRLSHPRRLSPLSAPRRADRGKGFPGGVTDGRAHWAEALRGQCSSMWVRHLSNLPTATRTTPLTEPRLIHIPQSQLVPGSQRMIRRYWLAPWRPCSREQKQLLIRLS